MANYYEISDIDPRKFVSVASRYADSKVIYYSESKKLTFPLYKKKDTVKSKQDKFTIISQSQEYRPDLTAYEFYGDPEFWWKILEANNIKDIYDYKAGKSIRIPYAFF